MSYQVMAVTIKKQGSTVLPRSIVFDNLKRAIEVMRRYHAEETAWWEEIGERNLSEKEFFYVKKI